jgi:hypothetical protein
MDGLPGHVDVSVDINTNPAALGCQPAARGFPFCSASVTHPARGYAAALGWIQLVRSTDGPSRGATFEMDPFEPLGPVSHPFCFFGFLPALFDAPSRDPIVDLEWDAHTFLCRLGNDEREAQPLLGFAWGFSVRNGGITPRGPDVLDARAWETHRAVLAAQHPAWSF